MRREIGSFISLDLKDSGEFYNSEINIARLNSARAGIYHSCRLYNCNSIYVPYYLCPAVKLFLTKNGIKVKPYYINERFEPLSLKQKNGHAVLLVNYFGILSESKIRGLASQFHNVIIDNSAAFYSNSVDGCYNVYSPRKFFGVPDGCYVIGYNAEKNTEDYKQDFSSVTASFLLKRIEFGLTDIYKERMQNEDRIDNSGILNMSLLTKTLLSNIDYSKIKRKRLKNFYLAHRLFKEINRIDPSLFIDFRSIPMVYPLVVEKEDMVDKLKDNSIYTGRWWKHVLTEVPETSIEAWLSKYMIPIPIDQRYDEKEIRFIYEILMRNFVH